MPTPSGRASPLPDPNLRAGSDGLSGFFRTRFRRNCISPVKAEFISFQYFPRSGYWARRSVFQIIYFGRFHLARAHKIIKKIRKLDIRPNSMSQVTGDELEGRLEGDHRV